jgi:signal peptidase I
MFFKKKSAAPAKKEGIVEQIVVIIEALLIALVIRTVFVQPFNIPSGSMKSTLLIGDYLMSTKWTYGYSKYSIPFAPPLFNGRIFASLPERGDVAIFRRPGTDDDYIKRVVGLPGDKIQLINDIVHINGIALKRERIEDFQDAELTSKFGGSTKAYKETMPNGVTYTVLQAVDSERKATSAIFTVEPRSYFMMGDNRDDSLDSRFIGSIPFDNFISKAQVLFFSVKEGEAGWTFWRWPWSVRFERLANIIR